MTAAFLLLSNLIHVLYTEIELLCDLFLVFFFAKNEEQIIQKFDLGIQNVDQITQKFDLGIQNVDQITQKLECGDMNIVILKCLQSKMSMYAAYCKPV